MFKKHHKSFCRALVFLFLLLLVPGFAQAEVPDTQDAMLPEWMEFTGWLETMHSFRIKSPHDKLTSRAHLRLEAKADFQWLYAFYSIDAEKNWVIDSETDIDTHEFWVEHIDDTWDIRIGRQIIIWGQADGVQVTDIISPPDLTESITRDLDEIRMPVDAIRFRSLADSFTVELICIPFFKGARYPEEDNPWALPSDFISGKNVSFLPADEPDTSFKNMELAAKVSAYLSGLDVAASVFHTWDDIPVFHSFLDTQGEISSLILVPRYHRLTVFGLEFSRPWGDFVFRGETALYKGRYLALRSPGHALQAKNSIKWLAGVDWSPGNDWSITAQLLGESIFHPHSDLVVPSDSFLGTLNISKKLMNQRLAISNMVYLNFNDRGFYDRIKASYEVFDGLHLSVGLDIFCGHEGTFDAYEDNSQIWFKAKYNF